MRGSEAFAYPLTLLKTCSIPFPFVTLIFLHRVSPENPFPAGLEDAIDAVAFCHSTREYNFDTSRVSIGGNSAGAGEQESREKMSSKVIFFC